MELRATSGRLGQLIIRDIPVAGPGEPFPGRVAGGQRAAQICQILVGAAGRGQPRGLDLEDAADFEDLAEW